MKVTIQGLDELVRNFDQAPQILKEESKKAMRKSTEIIKQRAKRTAGSPPIVFQGELARSIQNDFSALKGKVEATAKHAPFVEHGTRPHRPPSAPLERWARLKLGKPGIGFAIANKIAREGTEAKPYFYPAVKDSLRDIKRFFDDVADKIVVRLVQ